MKWIILFSAIIIMASGLYIYQHEQVHVEIYRFYGIESHIEYFSHFPYVVTIPEKECPNDSCLLAHSINETVGYNLEVIFLIISIGLLIIIAQKEFDTQIKELTLKEIVHQR